MLALELQQHLIENDAPLIPNPKNHSLLSIRVEVRRTRHENTAIFRINNIPKFIPAVAFLRKVTEEILVGAKVFFPFLGFPHLFLRSILLCRVLLVLERSSQKMSTLWEKQLRPQLQQLLLQQLNLKFYSTSCWMFFTCFFPNVEGQEVVTSVMSDVIRRIRVES